MSTLVSSLPSSNTFQARATLTAGGKALEFFRLGALADRGIELPRLPYCLRILLENLLRREDGVTVTAADIHFLATWDPAAEPSREIAFMPARVLMQDFTGVPAVVDLAAMRDAMKLLGGDPERINPLQPAELVIDHSVQVDEYGTVDSYHVNSLLELQRNRERYAFLKWGQSAFRNFSAVPPGMGICHQVNLEYLARCVFTTEVDGVLRAYPDTLVGTDSHTTMINGLGVLGWGVGGIEAEAAMLGQPVSMLVPQVVGFRMTGSLREGTTATDLVLTVTEMLSLADRATIANMAPEYGATCGIFPVDEETLRYLRLTGRAEEQVALVEAYYREQGLFHSADTPQAQYSSTLELDLAAVEPSLAGPKRPQDRVLLRDAADDFLRQLPSLFGPKGSFGERQGQRWEGEGGHAALDGRADSTFAAPEPGTPHEPQVGELVAVGAAQPSPVPTSGRPTEAGALTPTLAAPQVPQAVLGGPSPAYARTVRQRFGVDPERYLDHGSIVIAAITSCTNTSNPSVMIAAGLLAKKAMEHGLTMPPWVKTSLAPGSRVVTDYYKQAGLLPYLERLRFHVIGYGCTTCIGNSGALPADVSDAIEESGLVAASVLSGNRNFEGRINSDVRANYLMSPPLVVAYALAGTMRRNLATEPIGLGRNAQEVYLRDIWPTQAEVAAVMSTAVTSDSFRRQYATVTAGDEHWQNLPFAGGNTYGWEPDSTYIRRAPYFDGMPRTPAPVEDIHGARVLAVLGDSVTTDHISPAGSIKASSPAGVYLTEHGVRPADFNSYGSRRGNHEVMVRGTFANVRLRNRLAPGTEGGVTRLLPEGTEMSIFEAAEEYARRGTPLVILTGKEYGSGSSRDWAAKGPKLLGVRAVIAESYERIHRSNLIGMGILPLEYTGGDSAASLGLTGEEVFDFPGLKMLLAEKLSAGRTLIVRATAPDGEEKHFHVRVRIDTPGETTYYEHGGILQYVLRQLAG